MILTIDTTNKTIKLQDTFTLEELHNTLIELGIEDYSITMTRDIQYVPTITPPIEFPKYPWEQAPIMYYGDTSGNKPI